MGRLGISCAAAVLALGIGLTVARAGEKALKESEVPKPVLDAVKKKYPGAKLTGFAEETRKDKTRYEIQVEDGKRRIDVTLSSEGKIQVEEEAIAEDALPKEVKAGLEASKYAKWKLKKVERVVTEENEKNPAYELMVADGDTRFEVVFDKDGKITRECDHTPRKKTEKRDRKHEHEHKGGDDDE